MINSLWLESVPQISPAGARPDPGVSRLEPLLAVKEQLEHGKLRPEVAGLRPNALWEAIFLLHKAAHIMRAAQKHAALGYHSWALFSGYHGAYVGARAVIGLLGVTTPNLAGRQVLLDLFPEQPAFAKPKSPIRLQPHHVLCINIPKLEQRHLWELFQRVIRMTKASCWDDQVRGNLLSLDYEEISRRRNPFLYSAIYWPIEDLHVEVQNPGFCEPSFDMNGAMLVDLENEAFLLELCFLVLKLGLDLLQDLCRSAKQLLPEFELINEAFADKNPMYIKYFSGA